MPTVERTFSELLRHPNQVVDEIADHDVIRRCRDTPDLLLSDEFREQQREQ